MKIVLAGGGSGGHFYPMISVAVALRKIADEEKIVDMELFYMANTPYDRKALADNRIEYIEIPAGKMRLYFSLQNIVDAFKVFFSIFITLYKLFKVYPDVVFSKGGYPAVPVTIAAKILGIPMVIHESDAVPGRANKLAASWARRIAVSFQEAKKFFKETKVAFVGPIVREELQRPLTEGAFEYLKLNPAVPTIFVLGGSQGAQMINHAIIDALPQLLEKYQIVHQTGSRHFEEIKSLAQVNVGDTKNYDRYRPYPYLNSLALRMLGGVSDLIISRSGASTIGEISFWEKPAIMIPITKSNGDHQRKNAYSYARLGAALVIEEGNLKTHVLIDEIERILGDKNLYYEMTEAAKKFQHPESSFKVANEVIYLAKHKN